MADLEKSVAIIFEGVDQMGAGVDSATRQIDGIAGSVQKATEPMANLTKNVFAFEAALLAAGVAATGFAIKVAGDFDAGFREITTLIDEPTESLAGFRQEILDYSTESTQSLADINSALYNAISAGADYAESLELIALAERAAVAGKTDLDGALGTIQTSLNAYGRELEDAEYFSDLLFTTVANGVTTLPELGASISRVTGLAASAGVSFEEVNAAIATLTFAGAPTSEAVTQIRSAISNILSPTKQASDLAAELGLEFSAAALESKGFSGVLEDVGEATGGSTEQINTLFGSVQGLSGVLTLTGANADTFADNLVAMENSAGATEAAYDKMAGTVEQGSQKIQNAMTGVLIAVGDPLLEEFTGIQEAIAAIFNAIGVSISDGQLEGFVDRIESMMQGIEQTLRDVAKNLPEALEGADFSSFFNGIESVRDAIAELFGGADLTSADGLARVIETLGLAFETLSAYTAGAITALGPFLEQMASLAQFVLELNPAFVALVGAFGGLSLALNTVASGVIVFTGLIKPLLGSAGLVAKGTPLVASLAAVLAGPVGLAAAAGLAGTAIYKTGKEILGFNDSVDPATQAIKDQNQAIAEGRLEWDYATNEWVKAGEAQETLHGQIRRINQELSDSILGIDRNAEARRRESDIISEVNGKYGYYEEMVKQAMLASEGFDSQLEKTQALTADMFRILLDDLGPLEQGWKDLGDGVFVATNNMEDLRLAQAMIEGEFKDGTLGEEAYRELTERLEDMIDGTQSAGDSQKELANEVLKGEEAILAAREAVLDYELALEELASNERIRSLELFVDLQTAQIEGETARIEAAFNSINTAIESTGETLQELYGVLGSGDLSRFQEMDLEREIQKESERRDEAMRLQNELTKEQIEQMRVRTEALRSGDGLINISSDGLEPALEMIMWQIIEKVQLRANAEGQEFLLGLA